MADTSLWPVVLGGLLTGIFALGGLAVGHIATARRDAAQEAREAKKRRADKFEEMVAAVYEFEHWQDRYQDRYIFGADVPETVSPFAKVQSIGSVYFPQFNNLIRELKGAAFLYRRWIVGAAQRRRNNDANWNDGLNNAYDPYLQKRDALQNFAQEHFQDEKPASEGANFQKIKFLRWAQLEPIRSANFGPLPLPSAIPKKSLGC
jgi:hypothetical protein